MTDDSMGYSQKNKPITACANISTTLLIVSIEILTRHQPIDLRPHVLILNLSSIQNEIQTHSAILYSECQWF